jgi:6-phosphogluconate dehydrogenase
VVAYNRTVSKVDEFLAKEARGTKVLGAHSIGEMVKLLKRPRRVMLMVRAGRPVDEFIAQLISHLEPGDIIIDGGNSLFEDTNRRVKEVESKGMLYIGTGVSAVKKARGTGRALCREVRPRLGRTSKIYSRPLPPKSTGLPAAIGWAKTAPAIS